MKKALLLASVLATAISSQAQLQFRTTERELSSLPEVMTFDNSGAKTTANGDTIRGVLNFASNQLNNDSLTSFIIDRAEPIDSGLAFGTNPLGMKGFAERFDYNGRDSAVRVIGMYAIFTGNYANTSTKTINLRVWSQGARTPLSAARPRLIFNGFPATPLATQSASIRTLGINRTSNNDSLKQFTFSTPSAFLRDSFFVGFDMSYNWAAMGGDTIGVKTTRRNYRYKPYNFVQAGDTIVNVVNAIQGSNNTWLDNSVQGYGIGLHYCFFPILVVQYTTGVDGVTHNNLTFFGHSPNPANTTSNVHYSIKKKTDVSLVVYDAVGRVVYNYNEKNMPAGSHKVSIDLSNFAAGNYNYILRTTDGDGMASQLTVIK